MIIGVYTVRDTATEAFMSPFHAPTPGAAIRMFTDTVNDPNSMLHKHPNDFYLFKIGDYDDATGTYENCAHHALGSAHDYLTEQPTPPLMEAAQ